MSTKHKRRIKYLALALAPAVLIAMMALVSAISMDSPAVALDQPPCAQCHTNNTLIEGKATAWANSGHGTGTAYLRSTNASCAGCHSGGAFSAMVAAGQSPNQVTTGDHSPTRQSCRACHQIHETYTGTDWALETTAPVGLYAIEGTTFDGGSGNLCTNCHQPRRAAPVGVDGQVTGISSHWGPHHGPQSSMLLGTGGAALEGSAAGHYTFVGDTCVSCHLGANDNHTFTPSVAACTTCHAGASNFDIGGRQTAIQAKIDQLGTLLVNAGLLSSTDPAEAHPNVSSAPEDQAYALWNWILIAKEDRSKGVHNPAYTEDLLDASIALMQP
ncbi:MAG: hypothetical protein IBX61_07965 [Thermoleophilia bacterium]|nr:hypothetical protein [Thermoleophilia bacterium]